LRGRRPADPAGLSAGQEPGCARHLAALLPLARAGQAPALGRRAPALVRGRQAEAVHLASIAAREERRGDPPADRPTRLRQDRGRPGIARRLTMEIQVREHGRHVVVLTLDNQPRLNAMSRQMMADLARLWDELDRGSCRCVVLTGAGTRAFCAGADMSGALSASPDAAEAARVGLVNRVVPAEGLMAWALETAEMIAANSPAAVQAVKRQISSTIAEHALSREALEQELGDHVRASAYFQEGVTAFRE